MISYDPLFDAVYLNPETILADLEALWINESTILLLESRSADIERWVQQVD